MRQDRRNTQPTISGRVFASAGSVTAQIHIKGGVIQSVEILSGPRIFHAAVKAAMMQYKCVTDGAEVVATQIFDFKID